MSKTPFVVSILISTSVLFAQDGSVDGPLNQEDIAQIERLQEEQIERSESQIEPEADVRTPLPSEEKIVITDANGKCFDIKQIVVKQAHVSSVGQNTEVELEKRWRWLSIQAKQAMDKCLGVPEIKSLQKQLNQNLISRGYITTRVAVPQQNLSDGELQLTLIPGTISKLVAVNAPIGKLAVVFPDNSGDVYQQRNVDNALESIRRLAGQSKTSFDIKPANKLGQSDIEVKTVTSKRFHGSLTLDNSAGGAADNFGWSGSMIYDSPLQLYDALKFNFSTNGDTFNSTNYSRSADIKWEVPYGRWIWDIGAGLSRYKQTRQGFSGPIVYDGRSRNIGIGASYTAYRSADNKGKVSARLSKKYSNNYVNDTEVQIQRREITSLNLGYQHTQYLKDGMTIEAALDYSRSLRQFSDYPDVVIGAPEYDGKYQKLQASLQIKKPISLGKKRGTISTEIKVQKNLDSVLPVSQRLTLGSRSNVRGFDERSTISGEDGIQIRNEVSVSLSGAHQLYAGLDAGKVYHDGTVNSGGDYLIGASVGIRGQKGNINYDLSVATPLGHSSHIQTDTFNIYGQVSYNY
jgi:hemolysin activation/secretion protein